MARMSVTYFQSEVIADVIVAHGDASGFDTVSNTVAYVEDVDAAIASITEHMEEHFENLRQAGARTISSPAHRSVLRKLAAMRS